MLDRLSILTDEVSGKLVEALDWAVAKGLRYVELRMLDGVNVAHLTDEQVDRARREIDRRKLAVSAVASPVFKCLLDPNRPVPTGDTFGAKEEGIEAHFEKLERTALIAKKFGTRNIRIFSFWREKDPARHVPEIVAHLRRAVKVDAQLLLENETACNGGYAAEVAEIVGQVDGLRALWDPGNETFGGRSPYPEGYSKIKNFVGHVHLKDAFEGRCVPIGQGRAPLKEQIRALERDGYRGLYTLETRYTPEGGTPMQGSDQTLEGLKRLLA